MTWEIRLGPFVGAKKETREWHARTSKDSSRDGSVTIIAQIPWLPGRASPEDQERHAARVFHRCVKEIAAQEIFEVKHW